MPEQEKDQAFSDFGASRRSGRSEVERFATPSKEAGITPAYWPPVRETLSSEALPIVPST
jgi:hypothetical protein